MNYIEHIGHAVEYIEANLKSELNLADLAKAAGYSEYHFLRVFKQVTHVTPADYIRKRRISEIAREMDESSRSISDIAFEYGFNSKENFTRAFKDEHNCLPTEYKSAGNSLKLFDRFPLEIPPFEIVPKIVTLNGFSVTVYPNPEDTPPKFWNLYNCKKMSRKLSGGRIVADYGVMKWDKEKQWLDYYIGIKTSDANGDIAGTVEIEIPGGLYAVFSTPPASHFDFVATIHKTRGYIECVWLPNGEYKKTDGWEFETYIEASRTYSEDIYIPIEKKKGN
ncbi:MAG: AraC family transcriptional regulator [Oscillospiraceae bacterium]|nr:AraC family transcriptional regulator [Oscillospiraceae bacterium]